MPMVIQPCIRARETAMESNGLIQTRNSVGVTVRLAQEAAGTQLKVVPKEFFVFRGTKYIPS